MLTSFLPEWRLLHIKKNVRTFVWVKLKSMRVITTREITRQTKAYFELAETEQVAVKRGKNKYVNLVVTEEPDTKFVSENWVKEFLSIPAEYRVNPFDVSPSGDLFFADKRNLEHIDNARKGKTKKLSREEQAELFR
jgi:hypothetical protein